MPRVGARRPLGGVLGAVADAGLAIDVALMAIVLDIRHQFADAAVTVRATVGHGLTALLGPSGAGKSTVLNVIAGLLRPDHAIVSLDGDTLVDTTRNVWVPAHRRRIGYVFQDSRLFPHLTVRQNLLFGRWFSARRGRHPEAMGAGGGAGTAPPQAGQPVTVDDVVTLLDLGPLLARHPAKLSGGERRRVALGRALLSHPRLLLLDEPLGSLDVARRQEILPYLDRLIADLQLPMIYVTHDWDEVRERAAAVIRLPAETA